MFHFSTRNFEPADRHDAWISTLSKHCGPFEIKTRHDFDARVERGRIGSLTCTRMVQNSQYMRRGALELSGTQQDYYYLMLQVAGRASFHQGQSETEMAPGQIVMLDAGRPLSMEYQGKNAHIALHVPRNAMAVEWVRNARFAHRLGGAPATLLGSLMQTAAANMSQLDADQQAALESCIVSILAGAFKEAASDAAPEPLSRERSRAMVQIIEGYVNQRLGEGDLSPRTIAQAHGISIRHLQRLFKDNDTNLTGLVRRCRLARCAENLRDPALSDLNLTQIAYRWGFNDSAHFSRAFKDEFGQTPSDYRVAALGADNRCFRMIAAQHPSTSRNLEY